MEASCAKRGLREPKVCIAMRRKDAAPKGTAVRFWVMPVQALSATQSRATAVHTKLVGGSMPSARPAARMRPTYSRAHCQAARLTTAVNGVPPMLMRDSAMLPMTKPDTVRRARAPADFAGGSGPGPSGGLALGGRQGRDPGSLAEAGWGVAAVRGKDIILSLCDPLQSGPERPLGLKGAGRVGRALTQCRVAHPLEACMQEEPPTPRPLRAI